MMWWFPGDWGAGLTFTANTRSRHYACFVESPGYFQSSPVWNSSSINPPTSRVSK